jgi:hypothetical protein
VNRCLSPCKTSKICASLGSLAWDSGTPPKSASGTESVARLLPRSAAQLSVEYSQLNNRTFGMWGRITFVRNPTNKANMGVFTIWDDVIYTAINLHSNMLFRWVVFSSAQKNSKVGFKGGFWEAEIIHKRIVATLQPRHS